VNRRRIGLRLEGTQIPSAGTPVRHGGEEVGRITSAAFSPTLQAPIAMAILKRAAAVVDTRVELEIAAATVPAVVVEPPFVAPPEE
jgi:aminomethyltransferase